VKLHKVVLAEWGVERCRGVTTTGQDEDENTWRGMVGQRRLICVFGLTRSPLRHPRWQAGEAVTYCNSTLSSAWQLYSISTEVSGWYTYGTARTGRYRTQGAWSRCRMHTG
jgi:hypothetical protein